jgi:hypothetical protein
MFRFQDHWLFAHAALDGQNVDKLHRCHVAVAVAPDTFGRHFVEGGVLSHLGLRTALPWSHFVSNGLLQLSRVLASSKKKHVSPSAGANHAHD